MPAPLIRGPHDGPVNWAPLSHPPIVAFGDGNFHALAVVMRRDGEVVLPATRNTGLRITNVGSSRDCLTALPRPGFATRTQYPHVRSGSDSTNPTQHDPQICEMISTMQDREGPIGPGPSRVGSVTLMGAASVGPIGRRMGHGPFVLPWTQCLRLPGGRCNMGPTSSALVRLIPSLNSPRSQRRTAPFCSVDGGRGS